MKPVAHTTAVSWRAEPSSGARAAARARTHAARTRRGRLLAAALSSALLTGAVLHFGAWLANGGTGIDAWWWASLGAAGLAGSLAAALLVRRSIGGRLRRLAARLDERVEDRELLARLPDLGDDEVGRIAVAFNHLLARVTRLQGEAIDRDRELESTQRALELAEQLASKSEELEQRLRERALLFEVLRESTETHDLDRVLRSLVDRVGRAVGAREVAVALGSAAEGFVVRAAWGFEPDARVLGERVARPSAGPFAADQGVLLVPDVSRAPEWVRMLDAMRRDGSFALVPIVHRREEIGLLLVTRSDEDPLGELEARFVEAVADQAALAILNAQLIERLEELATHDELTGLPNRRLLSRRLERALLRADRYGHPLSVLALDLDHFKQLNDRHGHAAGDVALVEVAEVLRGGLRAVDTAARVGGEELLVLLPETDAVGAADVAEKLRARVAALRIEGAEEQPLGHLSVSIGVASRRPDEPGAALLARADEALYEAKRAGRDRVSIEPPAA